MSDELKRLAKENAALGKRLETVNRELAISEAEVCDLLQEIRDRAAERDEALRRVAELEDVKDIADMQPPFEGPIVGIEQVLDPARVLATAAIIYGRKGLPLSEAMCRKDSKGANPYRLKGASDE